MKTTVQYSPQIALEKMLFHSKLESPTEGITTAFITCENPHRIDDLRAPLVSPCFRDKYLPNCLVVFTLVPSVRCSVVIASVKLITIVFIALLVYEHYCSTSPLRRWTHYGPIGDSVSEPPPWRVGIAQSPLGLIHASCDARRAVQLSFLDDSCGPLIMRALSPG